MMNRLIAGIHPALPLSKSPHRHLSARRSADSCFAPRRQSSLAWRRVLPALLAIVLATGDPIVTAATGANPETEPVVPTGTMPQWDAIRATAASLMKNPQAGTDPLIYFVDPLGRQMGLPDAVSTLAAKKLPPALAAELKVTELAEKARRLIRSLAAWNLATAAQAAAEAQDQPAVEQLTREISDQTAWLLDGEEIPNIQSIVAAIPALQSNGSTPGTAMDEALYRDYATSLDSQYPSIAGTPDSWLGLLETRGIQGWRERLAGPDKTLVDGQQAHHLAERYTASRLRPLLRLSLAQQGSRLETWAAQQVYRNWLSIHAWKDDVRLSRGLARLCGSWQWTVHNHQNHGEQKLTVTFPPPGEKPAGGGPAETVAVGDVIYLRWEVAGRVQEDSLLFSKEAQRLEGSFMNNTGGWGSVTAKRTAGCPKK
ncbi:MAG: hypothetical protein AB7G68_03885 [Nitrospiraceae bacterium]